MISLKLDKTIREVEENNKELIKIAVDYMKSIDDAEHDYNHTKDVVNNTARILDALNVTEYKIVETCIISAYWHDVGRIKGADDPELRSAEMLIKAADKLGYCYLFRDICYQAIKTHKYNMAANTYVGQILKDADKLAFISPGRWSKCLANKKELTSIMNLLPTLRNDLLELEVTKPLYDEDLVNLVKVLNDYIYNK